MTCIGIRVLRFRVCISPFREDTIPTKAIIITAQMTRIKRIYADFALPAAKFFWPRIAQIFTNLGTNFVCAKARWHERSECLIRENLCNSWLILSQSRRRRDKNPR